MSKRKDLSIANLSETIIKRVVNDLFSAGCGFNTIWRYTGVFEDKAKEMLTPENKRAYDESDCVMGSPFPQNQALIDKILFDYEDNLSKDILIETERARFQQYKLVESKCIAIMHKLLDFYMKEEVGQNLNKDRFKLSLASEFIKATHSARAELIEKYRIDKETMNKVENDDNRIEVEFIDIDANVVDTQKPNELQEQS